MDWYNMQLPMTVTYGSGAIGLNLMNLKTGLGFLFLKKVGHCDLVL